MRTLKLSFFLVLFAAVFSTILSSCKKDDPVVTPEAPEGPDGFCFGVTKSTETFTPLQGAIEISGANADDIWEVDLGWTFQFCDDSFDKLYLAWDYSPTFTYKKVSGWLDLTGYELYPFGSIDVEKSWLDTGYISKFQYQTTGTAGNHVTTIEWLDFGFKSSLGGEEKLFSVQLKLHEKGNKISYHYGPSEVALDFQTNTFDFMAVGLYSTSDTKGHAIFLSDNPDDPTINSNSGNATKELSKWPSTGTVYTFE